MLSYLLDLFYQVIIIFINRMPLFIFNSKDRKATTNAPLLSFSSNGGVLFKNEEVHLEEKSFHEESIF